MKRILILSDHSFMLWKFRKELIETLVASDMEVTVGVPLGSHIQDIKNLGCKLIDTPLDRRSTNPFRELALLRQYYRILKAEKPDMVLTYSTKPNIYGGWACRRLRIPYCTNVQGLSSAILKPSMTRFMATLYRLGLKKAKTVFFENTGNAEYFRDRKIVPEQQQTVLPGAGINLTHYAFQPYPHNDPIRFLFVGHLTKDKGIDELLDAIKTLYDDCYEVRLDLIGFCDDDYKEQIDALHQAGIVFYHGFQEDPRPFYAKTDCVVLPSYHEGMSNVLLEGAATGRPVITCFIPGCREIVEHEVTGLTCRPRDKYGLYEAMRIFASMPWEARREMGLAGRARMEAYFDKQIVVEDTMNAIFRQ